MKSNHTREIVDVEDDEAEWLVEVLEELFDHVYIIPVRPASRREALNRKLGGLGKPPRKGSAPG
jgi:hypothetical protein